MFLHIFLWNLFPHRKLRRKTKNANLWVAKRLGFVCDCEESLAMIMIKYLDQLTKNWLYFFNMMEACYLVKVANYRKTKGQKTWELELIDGLSLTCFLYKKNSFPSVFPFFEYFRKNGQDFLFNPAAGNGFFRVEIRRTIGSKVGAEKEFSFPLRHRLIMQAFYYWRNFERRWFLPRPIYLQHFLFTRREGPKPKRRVIAQQEVRKWREQRSKPHL